MTREEIKQFIASKVAKIRSCAYAEIEEEIEACGGNMEIDSQEAAAAIAALERQLGRNLIGAKDLKGDQLTELNNVTDLVIRQLDNPNAGKGTRAISRKQSKGSS